MAGSSPPFLPVRHLCQTRVPANSCCDGSVTIADGSGGIDASTLHPNGARLDFRRIVFLRITLCPVLFSS